jgi:hypothetical protein
MASIKPWKPWLWIGACLVLAGLIYQGCRGSFPPKAYVGNMEANHPWLIFDPTLEQGLVHPYGDKTDPMILYLTFVGRNGDAVKVDLKTKSITPYHFPVNRRGDIDELAQRWKLSDFGSTWTEFRGVKETRRVWHVFGYPFPDRLGKTLMELRTGYYYIMDRRGNTDIELLRVKIENSDLSSGLGELYRSPDDKWLVFRLASYSQKVYIFSRAEMEPKHFDSGTTEKVLDTTH